jgi:hypothetical protein
VKATHFHCAVISIASAALLSSCQSPTGTSAGVRLYFPRVNIWGPYANRLTIDDVQQITDLALKGSDIRMPVWTIITRAENRADVETVGSAPRAGKYFSIQFKVHKKNSSWAIEPGSVRRHGGSIDLQQDQGPPTNPPASPL